MNAHYPGVYPGPGVFQQPYASAGPRFNPETQLRDTDGKRVCRHWERGNCSLGIHFFFLRLIRFIIILCVYQY
jgi:hypothetical protein